MLLCAFAALTALGNPVPQGLTGQALLDDLSRKAVKYFWEQSHVSTGFTLDRARNYNDPNYNPTVASIAATGYALAAYAVGAERGWIPRASALSRTRRTVKQVMSKFAHKNGWFYHFADWSTGQRVWNCELSSIDSAIFFNGLLMAERAFKDYSLTNLKNECFDAIDWRWMLTDGGTKPNSLTFSHGWVPNSFLTNRWDSFSEMLHLYLLAYAYYPDMPAGSWAAWARPVVTYNGVQMLVGGPLFMHQQTQGFYDLRDYRDPQGWDYFVEGRNATLGNRQYCLNNPQSYVGYGTNFWGLSACDIPGGYGSQGAPGWISDNGTVAPPAAVASLIFTRTLSIRAAETMSSTYPTANGRYGLAGGINPTQSWVASDVLGLDLGQMMLNIENARDGLPNKWIMSDPKVKAGYQKIGLVKTSEGPLEGRPLRIAP